MAFISFEFFLFLFCAVGLYHFSSFSYRPKLLLSFSVFFYCYFSIPYALVLAISSGVIYYSAIRIEECQVDRQKSVLLKIGIGFQLGQLILFKILDGVRPVEPQSWFSGVVLPLGISYTTFKLLSYLIDVYWEKYRAEGNFVTFCNYSLFFAQIPSGPIQRAGSLIP